MKPTLICFYSVLLTLLSVSGQLHAQDVKTIDSLTAKLREYEASKPTKAPIPADTAKVEILIKLVQNHLESDPGKALRYAEQQLELSEKLHYATGIANACVSLGAIYDLKSEYDKALQLTRRALAINIKLKNTVGVEDCYFNIGSLYGKQSHYNEALKYMLKGLEIAIKTKDNFGIGGGYNNLGVLYLAMGNQTAALKSYLKCLNVMHKMKNLSAMATTYNNIASIYLLQNKPDEAIFYNKKGLQLSKQSGNKQAEGDNYHSIGKAFYKKTSYKEALENYILALEIRKAIGDSYGLAESYINLGKVHFKQGLYARSIKDIEKGRSLAKHSGELDLLQAAYQALSETHEASGNFKHAFANHVLYKKMTDSLFNAEKDKKFVQLQMEYEFKSERDSIKAIQDKKDILAKAALTDQKIIRNFIAIGMIVIVFFLVIVIWQRNKIAIVKRQKALEAERNRISRDLHDNLGAQLSSVRIFLNNIKNKDTSEIGEAVDNSVGLLDTSIHDLRGIMEEMSSSVLYDRGYLAATENLINKLKQSHDIRFALTSHNMNERADRKIEHELYRITQELVNNTLKYANAKNITLDVIRRNGTLVLMYEDDGIGFDLKSVHKGYGLHNIETRIKSVGGTVDFDSTPSAGARTIIEIPL